MRQNYNLNFRRRNMNSEFVYSVTRGKIAMVWPCKKNGQNKDT